MNKIATHDSGTGEKSKNFLFKLFEPFAKTQTKTITEQWKAGVRYFDIRIDTDLTICHGLWKSNKCLYDVLDDLNYLAQKDTNNKTYYQITFERNSKDIDEYVGQINTIVEFYEHITCTSVNRKLPVWTTLIKRTSLICAKDYVSVPTPKQYFTFALKDWKRYIPIPKVLHKLYKRKHEFNNKYFVMVDFI